MKYLIVGDSAAGVGCIEGIRAADRGGEVTVVSAEARGCYSRPLISYRLSGKVDDAGMSFRGEDFFRENGVTLLEGREAVRLDPEGRSLMLKDGGVLPYDRLLWAAGSSPAVPPIPGLERVTNRTPFHSWDDEERLEAMLTPGARVLILGGGLVGIKCAEALTKKDVRVCVAEGLPRILAAVLDDEAAAMAQAHMERAGVAFRVGDAVASFDESRAVFRSGAEEKFGVLVLAAGVRPNISVLKTAGAACSRGILIDAAGRTSLPGVWAAGDCAEGTDCSTGKSAVMALWPNARLQGEAAGRSMAGAEAGFSDAIPVNATSVLGFPFATAGAQEGESRVLRGRGAYKRLFYGGGRLTGYIMAGDAAKAGIYTALIRRREPLDGLDLSLVCAEPSLLAFTAQRRDELLNHVETEAV